MPSEARRLMRSSTVAGSARTITPSIREYSGGDGSDSKWSDFGPSSGATFLEAQRFLRLRAFPSTDEREV